MKIRRRFFFLSFILCHLICTSVCDKFADDVLKRHNTYRNIHNSVALHFDNDLNTKAHQLANEAANSGKFNSPQAGENTFMLCTTYTRLVTAEETVRAWYDEVCNDFSFDKPNNPKARAFTQMVWNDTTSFGIGKKMKKDDDGSETCTFVVALYRPAGNVVVQGSKTSDDEFKENVKKGKFDEKYCNDLKEAKRDEITSQKRKRRDAEYSDENTDINESTNIDENRNQVDSHDDYKRSLYYRFPARFLIDPVTGQTKAVAPEKTAAGNAKSQLGVAPQYDQRYVAGGMPYGPQMFPYANENAYFGQPMMPSYMPYPNTPAANYAGQKSFESNHMENTYGPSNYAAVFPSPIEVDKKKIHKTESAKKREKGQIKVEKANHKKLFIKTGSIRTIDDEVDKKQLQSHALAVHNAFRKIHDTPPLELDEKLCTESEEWAKKIANDGELKHSEAKDYGENLAYRCTGDQAVSNVNDSVADWYQEVCDPGYDFSKSETQGSALHFTQVVWKGSKKLGIGMATSKKDGMLCTYFVGRYTPKGNMMGDFLENVIKGTFVKDNTCKDIEKIKNQAQKEEPELENKEQTTGNETNKPEEGAQSPGDKPKGVNPTEPSTPNGEETISEKQQDQDEKNYEDDALKVVNKFRDLHGSPPLEASNNLHEQAKTRADNFVSGMVKRTERKQEPGECVQVACNPVDKVEPPEEAISNWYREVCGKNYSFEEAKAQDAQSASHFTQMVWKSTTKVGIAYSTKKKRNGDLCTVIVAKFDPIGNLPSEFVNNVKKGNFDRSYCGSINTIAGAALEGSPTPVGSIDSEDDDEYNDPDDDSKEANNATKPPPPPPSPPKPENNDTSSNNKSNNDSKKPEETKPAETNKPSPANENSLNNTKDKNSSKETPYTNPSTSNTTTPEVDNEQPKPTPSSAPSPDEKTKPTNQPEVTKADETTETPPTATPEVDNEQSKPTPSSTPSSDKKTKPTSQPEVTKSDETTEAPPTTTPAPDANSGGLKASDLTDDDLEPAFVNEGLTAQNALRSIHGAPALTDSYSLTKKAKEIANDIAIANSGNGARKKDEGLDFGENVEEQCFNTDKKLNADEAVLQWWTKGFCEEGESTFSKQQLSPGTQVVWKASKEFGIARTSFKKNEKYCTVVVALYQPKGNVEGEYDENVSKGDFDYNMMCDDANGTLQTAKELLQNSTNNGESDPDTTNQEQPMPGDTTPSSSTNKPEETNNKKPNQSEEKNEKEKNNETESNSDEQKDNDDFAKDGLKHHNTLRKIHDAPLLKLSAEMSKEAHEYAKKLSELGSLRHAEADDRNGDGENLAYTCTSDKGGYPASNPVAAWYGEVCNPGYNFETGGFASGTGHFTQLVWKKSGELGMGFASSKKGDMTCYYAVARYRNAGNMMGDFKENVMKGEFNKDKVCEKDYVKELLSPNSSKKRHMVTVVGDVLGSPLRNDMQAAYKRKVVKGILKKAFIQPAFTSSFRRRMKHRNTVRT